MALMAEEAKRGWDNMKHRKKCSRSPVCQEIQHRGGDTGEAPPCFYEHERLLTDEFSFSPTAGPVEVPAKLRICSLGVTWSLWIWPKVKLR